jgi:signal transduction histidine kinase
MGPDADPDALVELDAAAADARAAIDELRELARGLHPAILAEGGLRPALESLAERSSVPTTLSADLDGPIPPAIEATVYFVVAEALTNTAKYADARSATIRAVQTDSRLLIEVTDDGRGGADPAAGTGLRGLEDRVGAVGGTMRVVSPPGGGTTISVDLPCASS